MQPDLLEAIAGGYADAGMTTALIQAKTGVAIERPRAVYKAAHRPRSPAWTADEDALLRELVGHVHEDEIARRLGRTVGAVHLRWKRDLRLRAPTKRDDVWTALAFCNLIGSEIHIVTHWCDSGLLPSRMMPGGRRIRLIDRAAATAWLINPDNWVYFDRDKIRDERLARLVARRLERWGDDWWTTRQAADYLGCDAKDVMHQIKRGRVPGRRVVNLSGRHVLNSWGNWFVLRSDAMRLRIPRGKGGPGSFDNWSDAAQEFMELGAAIGVRWQDLARMQNVGEKTLDMRYRTTAGQRRITTARLHDHAARFPRLARVAAAFARGEDLGLEDLRRVILVLRRFGLTNKAAVRGLVLPHHSKPSIARVRAFHAALKARGHDPLEVPA
jgi:hypothetical protein